MHTEWVGGDDTWALLCHDIDLFIWGGLEKDIGVIPWWKKPLDGTDDAWNFMLWSWNYKFKAAVSIYVCWNFLFLEFKLIWYLRYLFLVVVIWHRNGGRQWTDDFRWGWRAHLGEFLGHVVHVDLDFRVIKFFLPVRPTVIRLCASVNEILNIKTFIV